MSNATANVTLTVAGRPLEIRRFGESNDWGTLGRVTVGELFVLERHPSGKDFDGVAITVGCWTSSTPGVGPIVSLVSLKDPTHRVVVISLAELRGVERCPRCGHPNPASNGACREARCF